MRQDDATVANGKVSPSGAKYDVAKGSTVTINVSSDANETVHVHGYDIETHVIDATIATLNVR